MNFAILLFPQLFFFFLLFSQFFLAFFVTVIGCCQVVLSVVADTVPSLALSTR